MLAYILPLLAFALASSMTPGPNNLLLAASGIRFGFKATIPHMAGVHMGYSALLIAVGLGLGAVFERWPILQQALRIGGTVYILYLSWRILRGWSVSAPQASDAPRPIGFVEAALFQFINPKGVIMAITMFAAYSMPGAGVLANIALIVGVAAVVNVLSVTTWAGFGAAVQGLAGREPAASIIRWVLALMTVASVAMLYI